MNRISVELDEGLVARIRNGRHEWTADEPPAAGGTDSGPNPYELLLGALAACTCITIAMYCRHKELKLDAISATFEFRNIHADDCESCDDDMSGYIDHITSDIRISGDFNEQEKKRIAQIATRCPVHKTLEKGAAISDHTSFL